MKWQRMLGPSLVAGTAAVSARIISTTDFEVGMFDSAAEDAHNAFGTLASMRYTLRADGWNSRCGCTDLRRKLLAMLFVAHDHASSMVVRLTVVRLDAVIDAPSDTVVDARCANDAAYAGTLGWPQTVMVAMRVGSDSSVMISVPPFTNGDYTTTTFMLPEATRPSYRGPIPQLLYTSGRDTDTAHLPIVAKIQRLFRLQHPHWTLIDTPLDAFPRLVDEWEGQRAASAIEAVQPAAFKADIFRIVALYHTGGVWLDAKVVTVGSLDHWLSDAPSLLVKDAMPSSMFNGVMAFGRHDALARVYTEMVIDNVLSKTYGRFPLDVTGPRVLHSAVAVAENHGDAAYSPEYHLSGYGLFVVHTAEKYPIMVVHNVEYRRTVHGTHHNCHYENQWKRRTVFYEAPCVPGSITEEMRMSLPAWSLKP